MLDAELLVRIPKNWMSEVTERFGARLKVVDRKPSGTHGVQDLVEVEFEGAEPAEVLALIEANPSVSKASLDPRETGRALANVTTRCVPCHVLATSKCFLVRAGTRPDGHLDWELIGEDRDVLNDLVSRLQGSGCDVTLGRIREATDEEALTRRQEEILRVAFERGYFDYPKRVGIRDLAAVFHVSISTVSEILRKGQTKVLESYFGGKRGG